MHIDDETTDVLIGGYLSTDAAHEDYDAVLNCGARLWGAVVVSKDLEGNLSVEETDHAVEEGAAGLAGSASWSACSPRRCWPPRPSARPSAPPAARCSTRSSATASAKKAGDTIPIGGAGLIVAYPRSAAETGRTRGHPRRARRSSAKPRGTT